MSANIQRSLNILRKYYRTLADDVAKDVVEHWRDFDSPDLSTIDSMLERHSRRLCDLSQVFDHLRRFAPKQKPDAGEPLSAGEFRCFGCGGVIKLEDEQCKKCGWTWI